MASVASSSDPVNFDEPSEELAIIQEEPIVLPLGNDFSLRLYADSRPHNLESTELQKGLVLTLNGKELIEEGVGFGVPVAVYADKTYFSGSSSVLVNEDGKNKIIKHFSMDTISRKRWNDKIFIDTSIYRLFINCFMSIYRNHPSFRNFFLYLIVLRNKLGIRTHFVKVKPRGEIAVKYKVKESGVNVEIELTKLDRNHLRKIIVLNEQGSTFFDSFVDSNGLSLNNERIGAWDLVKAEWACLSISDGTIGFSLQSIPNCELLRGREYIKGRLAWAGLAYELDSSLNHFSYEIYLKGLK